MRTLFLALAVVSLSATPALAAPCKDAKGKFIKCPEKKPVAAKKCRLNGKFAKCGTPGAKPV
ncbi:MAG: hypothetical protein J0J06_00535 [Sphingomonas sp.]|uniref:hypothetical protein n=1 Tax=Sphingomonas sp. TaxID=28214 RepID=UPI001AD5FE1B|nr:hypothetical protein [Sphingomonas sp.]MBN8813913.1 hypothetical protein [Sphingomonas sp.]